MINNARSLLDKSKNFANKNNVTINKLYNILCLRDFWEKSKKNRRGIKSGLFENIQHCTKSKYSRIPSRYNI